MFNNIGKKVQGLAKFLFWLCVICSLILAISMFVASGVARTQVEEEAAITSGFIWLIAGPIGSWVSCCLLYLIGQMADDLHAVRLSTSASTNPELRQAMNCMSNKEYDKALRLFRSLKGHIDCESMILECKLGKGEVEKENGNYDKAIDIFQTLPSSENTRTQIKECWYLLGKKHFENQDYDVAYDAFVNADNFPGAAEMRDKLADMDTPDDLESDPDEDNANMLNAKRTVHPKAIGDNGIMCPACGCKQQADRNVCLVCGAKFK